MKPFFLFCLLALAGTLFAQLPKGAKAPAIVACDCKAAVAISVGTTSVYGLTEVPAGPGNIAEISSSRKNDPQAFEQEHHSAWYLLTITRSGELVFEVVPQDTTNDYDFILYPYSDSTFCKSFPGKKNKPVRSNISRNRAGSKGVTGLSSKATNLFTPPGIGTNFSASLPVKKGERYMLVLDNVYPGGKGHWLYFNFMKQVTIKGIVSGDENRPVAAEITLSDSKGNVVEQTNSDAQGAYEFQAPLKENLDYSLTFLNDSSFVSAVAINTKALKNSTVFPDIKTVLPKLKKGAKYRLGNINFHGNEATLLPASYASVESLYKLMKKNRKMVIQVEGHVNDPQRKNSDKGAYNQKLSDDRAATVKKFLVDRGIEEARIQVIGLSNKKMLFPRPVDEFQSLANRRVEINVISID